MVQRTAKLGHPTACLELGCDEEKERCEQSPTDDGVTETALLPPPERVCIAAVMVFARSNRRNCDASTVEHAAAELRSSPALKAL